MQAPVGVIATPAALVGPPAAFVGPARNRRPCSAVLYPWPAPPAPARFDGGGVPGTWTDSAVALICGMALFVILFAIAWVLVIRSRNR